VHVALALNGINGTPLVGAMANRRTLTLDFLRARWLDLGDFSKLLWPLGKRARPRRCGAAVELPRFGGHGVFRRWRWWLVQ
jgi:hypothetical protein